MRKIIIIGAMAAGLLNLAGGAGAATVGTDVSGALSNSDNGCINVIPLLSANDCSYAATRYPVIGGWQGPIFSAAYYPPGSIVDDPNNNGVEPDGQDFRPSPGDGKLSVPMSGILTVDDSGTAADGTDDRISGSFSFGAADHWVSTGNGDQALERWTSWAHTLVPTAVDFATPRPGGGFEYVIGVRGKPTPAPLTAAANATQTFSTEYAPTSIFDSGYWSQAGASQAQNQRIGIERSAGFGNVDNTGTNLQPNAGAQTTATLANYACLDADNDCTTSSILVGTSLVPGTAVTLPPGFTNLVLIVTTGADGRVATGEAYWTREYLLKVGPAIGNDPSNPNQWTTNNSWTGGRFTFTGSGGNGQVTKDACKNGGWAAFGFRNQGQCIASVVSKKGGR